MSDENVIRESAGSDGRTYRVRLELDASPAEPYHYGSTPLWRIDYGGLGWRAEQVTATTSFDASGVRLSDAVNRFGGPTADLVERWLKAYHGTTIVETWHSGSAWYLTADTEAWRKEVEVDAELLRREAEKGSLMSEYQAWCAGDVYGYIIETKVSTYTVVIEPADGEIIGTRHDTEWREAEDGSCWGFYGYDDAVTMANEALTTQLNQVDRRVNAHRYERITLKES